MKKIHTSLLAGMLASVFIFIAFGTASAKDEAQVVPDALRGKALSERLCVNCHVISEDIKGTVPEGVPPFKVIANKPGQSAEHIRNILLQPHAPMPNMNLSRLEIFDIIAYLDELRLEGSGPSLLPDKQQKDMLPEIPEPS